MKFLQIYFSLTSTIKYDRSYINPSPCFSFFGNLSGHLAPHVNKNGFLRFSLSQPLPQPPPVVEIFPKLFISLVTILPF